eukprot:1160087-Pelagomonas_calceolata.AAC.11
MLTAAEMCDTEYVLLSLGEDGLDVQTTSQVRSSFPSFFHLKFLLFYANKLTWTLRCVSHGFSCALHSLVSSCTVKSPPSLLLLELIDGWPVSCLVKPLKAWSMVWI